MFDHLPSDLTRHIFQDYLHTDAVALSRLDRAVCCHAVRSDFLHLLAAVTVFPTRYREPKDTGGYLHWLGDRRVRVREINISETSMPTLRSLKEMQLPHVHKIHFHGWFFKPTTPPVDSMSFLSMFPSLKTLDLQGCRHVPDDMFTAVYLFCPLETLNLRGCRLLTSKTVLFLVVCVSSTLQCLQAEVAITDGDLLTMSKCCRKLKTLQIGCNELSHEYGLLAVCAGNQLEKLDLCTSHDFDIVPDDDTPTPDAFLNDELIIQLIPYIQHIQFLCFGEGGVHIDMLFVLLQQCPALSFVSFEDYGKFWFCLVEPDAVRVCEVEWVVQDEVLVECLGLCFRRFISDASRCAQGEDMMVMTAAHLRMLADHSGKYLEHLHCTFEDIADMDLLYLLRRCPELKELRLARCDLVTMSSLAQFHTLCPHITDLTLTSSTAVTDDTLLVLLIGYESTLELLDVNLCIGVTDVSLIRIADTCNRLEYLGVQATSVTKETMVELIISNRLTVADVDCWDSLWITQQVQKVTGQYEYDTTVHTVHRWSP